VTGIHHLLHSEEQTMFSNPKKFTCATQTLLASQVATFQALGTKAAEGVEKAVALNIEATKASVANSVAAARQLTAAKDPQAFFSLTAAQAQPAAETVASYGRDLTEIATGMWAEFMNAAEIQFSATQSQVTALAGEAAKSAPAGAEQAVAVLKSAVDHANASAGQLMKATKQAVETLEAQMVDATAQFTSAAKAVANPNKK
jgi:phasin family protein